MDINNTVGRAAEVQTTFLDAADELDQPQSSVSFGTAVEGVPDPSMNDSDVKPSRTTRRNRKRRQRKRYRAPAPGRENLRREGAQRKRYAEAVENAMTVPVELINLRPSLKPRRESRAYRHEELAQLGVRTIQWDGVYIRFPLPGFIQLT